MILLLFLILKEEEGPEKMAQAFITLTVPLKNEW